VRVAYVAGDALVAECVLPMWLEMPYWLSACCLCGWRCLSGRVRVAYVAGNAFLAKCVAICGWGL